jgi:arylsulfatase A-like enzyme
VPAGRKSDAVFATIDFMPTFAKLCGFNIPDDRKIDGIDQTDLLLGKSEKGRDTFYFDRAGMRMGKWKYLKADAHFYGYAREDERIEVDELYNLNKDLEEKNNLAKKYPKILTELRRLTESMPKDGPGGIR